MSAPDEEACGGDSGASRLSRWRRYGRSPPTAAAEAIQTGKCPIQEEGEVVVCGRASADSPYRYPKLADHPGRRLLDKDGRLKFKVGKIEIGGGGPNGSAGLSL